MAGRLVARPPPGSAELPKAVRRALRRRRGRAGALPRLHFDHAGTLTMLAGRHDEYVGTMRVLGLGLRLRFGFGFGLGLGLGLGLGRLAAVESSERPLDQRV
eukprot:scaffold72694_cov75-Phaeocystis_antarctica.AAC.5